MKGTISELAKQLSAETKKDLDYNATRGYIQVMEAKGKAKCLGPAPRPEGAKGKPSKIYQLEA